MEWKIGSRREFATAIGKVQICLKEIGSSRKFSLDFFSPSVRDLAESFYPCSQSECSFFFLPLQSSNSPGGVGSF